MEIVYEEKLSGATQDRPELQKMLDSLQQGDITFVTDLTQITRSTRDLYCSNDSQFGKKGYIKRIDDLSDKQIFKVHLTEEGKHLDLFLEKPIKLS